MISYFFPYRDESKEARLRAAESHLKLGEVSLETGKYPSLICSLVLLSTRKLSRHKGKIVNWDIKHQNKQKD